MDCANARVFLCPELDGELSVTDSALLHEHLRICLKCSQEWEALLLVHQNVGALKTSIVIPDKLEDRLIVAINREARKDRIWHKPSFRALSFAAMSAVACVCLLLMFLPTQRVRDSVETLVSETADGTADGIENGIEDDIDRPAQKSFSHIIGFNSTERSAAARSAGLPEGIRDFAHLKVAAFDVYQGKDGRRILRACYQDRKDHSFCVDCYQVNSGLLSFKGGELPTDTGPKVLFKRVGVHNVVMLSRDGMDYVYTSTLPKERLLSMVLERS